MSDTSSASKKCNPSVMRRWVGWRQARWWLVAFVIAILFLPTLTRFAFVRQAIFGRVTACIQGTLAAARLSTAWTRGVFVRDLVLAAPDGTPVLSVPEFEGKKNLWNLFVAPRNLGEWHARSPVLDWSIRADGSNIADAFAPKPGTLPGGLRRFLQVRHGRLYIEHGTMNFHHPEFDRTWNLGELNTAVDTIPASEGSPAMLSIASGRLIDHLLVTPEITSDFLKFLAPVLANATRIRGEFSIENESLQIPWEDFPSMEGKGTLSLHRVEVSAGPIISQIAAVLGVDANTLVVDECCVPYQVHDRSVEHQGLELEVGRLRVISSGTVWIDERVQLQMVVQFPEEPVRDGPLATRLAGKEVYLPLVGTLRKPKLDMAGVLRQNQGNWPLIEGLAQGSQDIAEIVREWRESRGEAEDTEGEFRILPGPLGDRLRARLKAWQQEDDPVNEGKED
jgi:hypothetical protein